MFTHRTRIILIINKSVLFHLMTKLVKMMSKIIQGEMMHLRGRSKIKNNHVLEKELL